MPPTKRASRQPNGADLARSGPAKVPKEEDAHSPSRGPSKIPKEEELTRPGPSKVPKEEELQDVKYVIPFLEETNGGSVSFMHVKGPIMPEQLHQRKVLTCEYCTFTAMTDDRLTAHREQKHRIYLCRFCKTEWDSKFEQAKHLKKCDKLLAMRKKVKKQCQEIQDRNHTHVAIQCMHEQAKCPICKETFPNMFEMGDRQIHRCKSYAIRLFQCNGCEVQFQTANGLKSHLIAKFNEKDAKCFNTGMVSFECIKPPKYARRGAHTHHDQSVAVLDRTVSHNSRTFALVPIKDEPTVPDEFHDERTMHALVAAHLLSDHDGTKTTEYYYAMKKMFFRVNCPFCGITCRTHAALHSHGLVHHPPYERCLYQCGGCRLTYQTPTGLGQHLKREFDRSNKTCYNTVNLVKKQDYLGPVTGWNKKIKDALSKKKDVTENEMFPNTIDVPLDPNFNLDEVVKKEELDDYTSFLASPNQNTLSLVISSHMSSGNGEVKEEPLDDCTDIKLEPVDNIKIE